MIDICHFIYSKKLKRERERGGGIQEKKFGELFSKEYMIEHQLVKVRLTEQLVSGTIIIENNCVKLTKFGETLAFISQHFRKHFLAKNRLLSGKYTNELTEILKFNSKNNSRYFKNQRCYIRYFY